MTVAFTGHRQINGKYPDGFRTMDGRYSSNDGLWSKVYNALLNLITTLHHKYGHVDFISGGAVGFDQVAAKAVIDLYMAGLPIQLIMAIPFEGQESKWSRLVVEGYNYILGHAHEVHYVCEPGYAPWKMQKRNEWMVDRAKTIVALYLSEGKTGGTLNCINYAMKHKKPLITIHPLTQRAEGMVFNYQQNKYVIHPI